MIKSSQSEEFMLTLLSSVDVPDRKIVLYNAKDEPLARRIGFVTSLDRKEKESKK